MRDFERDTRLVVLYLFALKVKRAALPDRSSKHLLERLVNVNFQLAEVLLPRDLHEHIDRVGEFRLLQRDFPTLLRKESALEGSLCEFGLHTHVFLMRDAEHGSAYNWLQRYLLRLGQGLNVFFVLLAFLELFNCFRVKGLN